MTESFDQQDNPTPSAEPEQSASHLFGPSGPPVLTRAYASAVLGVLAIPSCFCLGLPSIIMGALAIGLSIWVRKNNHGDTASQTANQTSWVGTIAGAIGIVLGIIAIIMLLATGAGIGLNALSRN